jgi:hypothetical protein
MHGSSVQCLPLTSRYSFSQRIGTFISKPDMGDFSAMKRYTGIFLIFFTTLFFTACSTTNPATVQSPQPTTAPPTLLPTAVPPRNTPGTWAISFEYSFPSNFWDKGTHLYGFFVDCPTLIEETIGGEWRWFNATDEAQLFESPIFLRLAGLSHGLLAPIEIDTIHPEQATIAVVTILGVTLENVELATSSPDCEVLIRWDDKTPKNLVAGEPFQP